MYQRSIDNISNFRINREPFQGTVSLLLPSLENTFTMQHANAPNLKFDGSYQSPHYLIVEPSSNSTCLDTWKYRTSALPVEPMCITGPVRVQKFKKQSTDITDFHQLYKTLKLEAFGPLNEIEYAANIMLDEVPTVDPCGIENMVYTNVRDYYKTVVPLHFDSDGYISTELDLQRTCMTELIVRRDHGARLIGSERERTPSLSGKIKILKHQMDVLGARINLTGSVEFDLYDFDNVLPPSKMCSETRQLTYWYVKLLIDGVYYTFSVVLRISNVRNGATINIECEDPISGNTFIHGFNKLFQIYKKQIETNNRILPFGDLENGITELVPSDKPSAHEIPPNKLSDFYKLLVLKHFYQSYDVLQNLFVLKHLYQPYDALENIIMGRSPVKISKRDNIISSSSYFKVFRSYETEEQKQQEEKPKPAFVSAASTSKQSDLYSSSRFGSMSASGVGTFGPQPSKRTYQSVFGPQPPIIREKYGPVCGPTGFMFSSVKPCSCACRNFEVTSETE